MHPSLHSLAHRPWPLPSEPWQWRQSWLDLAFLHYPVAVAELQALLPPHLKVDLFAEQAWVGLVPFRMAGVGRRPLSRLPLLPSFLEVNVRTYVTCHGRPGVWFFSLDAASRPLVFGGRRFYGLPYHFARMQLRRAADWLSCSSSRPDGTGVFRGRYRPIGAVFAAEPGTFAHWATERYCLYSCRARDRLTRVDVHHAPWPLQDAEVEIQDCSLLAEARLRPVMPQPIAHFSAGVDVISYAPTPAGAPLGE